MTFVFIQRSLGVVIDRSIARYDKHGENEIVPSWPIASITDHSRSFSLSLPDFYLEISFESLLQIFQRLVSFYGHIVIFSQCCLEIFFVKFNLSKVWKKMSRAFYFFRNIVV